MSAHLAHWVQRNRAISQQSLDFSLFFKNNVGPGTPPQQSRDPQALEAQGCPTGRDRARPVANASQQPRYQKKKKDQLTSPGEVPFTNVLT